MSNVIIGSEEYTKHYFSYFWLTLFVLISLYFLQPILPFITILSVLGLILWFLFFIKYPFVWICFMIIATGIGDVGVIYAGVTIFHLTWFLGILSLVLHYLYVHNKKFYFYTPINVFVFLYVIFSAISLIYSPNIESAVIYLAVTIALFIFYLMVVNLLDNKKHYRFIIFSLIISNIIISLFTVYQLSVQNTFYFGRQAVESISGDKIWRASGTYNDPNVAASFLAVGIIMTISVIIYSKEKKYYKILYLFATIIALVGIAITFSRSGWVTLATGVITLVFFQKIKKKIVLWITSIVIALVLVIIFVPFGGFIVARAFSIFDIIKDPSIHIRILLALSGIDMFLQSPIIGLGYRSFPILYDYFRQPLIPYGLLYIKESHTLIVTLLAELGIVGFSIVLMWFRRFFIDCFRLINEQNDSFIKSIVIGCFAVFVSLNFCFLFYGNLFPHFNFIWLIFGIVYSIKLKNL